MTDFYSDFYSDLYGGGTALLPPPSVPVFPAGYDPLPSDFTNWITGTTGFQAQGIVFRAVQTLQQALPSGSTTLSFDTVLEDTYSGWNPTANLWLAPFTGWYQAEAFCSVSAAAVNLQATIVVDGSASYTASQAELSSGTMGGGSAFAWVFLVAGTDFVQAQATPSSPQSTDVSTLGREPSFSITWISQ